MNNYEVTLPAMGEGIIEATITRWFVAEGDFVKKDEPLVEVATDKVDSEIPSPVSGRISRIICHQGEIPKIGKVLAVIETDEEEGPVFESQAVITETTPEIELNDTPNDRIIINKKKKSTFLSPGTQKTEDIYLTPLIRFLARDRGISIHELQQIKGTGLKSRITKDDLNAYILSGRPFKETATTIGNPVETNGTFLNNPGYTGEYQPGPDEEVIEMDKNRKLIAEHMIRSKRVSPHVTSMVEVDVTQLVQWREVHKDTFYSRHGIKLTYTPVVVRASIKALKDYPDINISVIGNRIIKKHYFNIGVATALPDGNLIVPVIKNADRDNFVSIARKLADLAERARNGNLLPAEIKGGTFTITNMGQYENVSGTPIINQPEVAILAVGAIKKKPAVVKVNSELTIGIRDIMVLSLTYDHRVIDGSLGGSFVRNIGRDLENDIPEY